MPNEHVYEMETRMIRPMFAGVKIPDMEEFEVTSAKDWWPDAPEGKFSPQTLFAAASSSCIILSMFKAANAIRTEFKDVKIRVRASMQEDGPIWRFEKIDLDMTVIISDEKKKGKVEKVINLAHKSCPITNSLNCPTNLEYEIVVE
jgi:uncharacterized OsmC-like protein